MDVSKRNTKTGEVLFLGDLRSVTRKVRNMSPEVYADRRKGKVQYLPLVTFGGEFSERTKEGLLASSGLIGLDIDHISKLGGVSLEELKDRLSQDREIGLRLLFTSPSGDGLKIVCETSGDITDPASYKREFDTLNYFVSQKYNIPLDTGEGGLDQGISDICRGCLLCYDPGAIYREGEDTFRSDLHPLPKKEEKKPRIATGGDFVSSWDWNAYEEERLIPALFERIEEVFPEMDFKWRGKEWQSPYKLGGSPAKSPRQDKTYISRDLPGLISEHGGESINILSYYAKKNNLSRSEARKALSRLCGLEEEERELSWKYAQQMNNKATYMDNTPKRTEGGETAPQEVQNTPQETGEERFQEYLQIQNIREIATAKKEGIKTGYTFKDSRGREENLLLPSGALTLICGKSSHGKSRLLQNLSLQIAREEADQGGVGVVLYFSFEEGLLEVVERYANMSVNIPRLSKYGTNNTEVLRDYFKTGTLSKAPQATRQEALPKLAGFNSLYESGRLRIYYTPDLLSGELCSLLEYLSSKMQIKAVFLDYVQAIYKGNGYRKDRREELREICKDINKTAISLQIPIVLSAQLNRETPNPTDMSGENIAESADITRYANTILLLWDSAKSRDVKDKDKYLNSEEGKRLKDRGFILGEPGKIYAIIAKNRGGTPNIETLLDYVPETGKIHNNEDLPPEDTGSLGDTEDWVGGFLQG